MKDCLIVFVLDQSGSMTGVVDATCKGFNEFVTEQARQPGKTLFSLTLFDTAFVERYTAKSLLRIKPLGEKSNTYRPGGMTALLDAVGTTIKTTERWIEANKWSGDVKVVVLTDGMENSSQLWHIKQPRQDDDDHDLNGLIEWKSKEGWDFLFLGAGGTGWLEQTFDTLPRDAFYAYSGDVTSTQSTYAGATQAMTTSRATGQSMGSSMPPEKEDDAKDS